MMDIEDIKKEFFQKISAGFRIVEDGPNRYRVCTPFVFDDGDHPVIILRQDDTGLWRVTDEGHTFMRLSYSIGGEGQRNDSQKAIEAGLIRHGIHEEDGELFIPLDDVPPGDVLFSFIQDIILMEERDLFLSRPLTV